MQEIPGENAGEIGQQHLRFVRRGVCCCSAVARESSLNAVALLGRFLPRLGPPPQGERPLSFSARTFLSALGVVVVRAVCSADIPPPLNRPRRNALSGISVSRTRHNLFWSRALQRESWRQIGLP